MSHEAAVPTQFQAIPQTWLITAIRHMNIFRMLFRSCLYDE